MIDADSIGCSRKIASLWRLSSLCLLIAFRIVRSTAFRWLLLSGSLLIFGGIYCRAADPPVAKPNSSPPTSQVFQGKVTAIIDGDTLHLDTKNAKYVVDLAGIDAPEKGQPSGSMAAQVLYLKVLQKEISLLVLAAPSPNPVVVPVTPKPTPAPTPNLDPSRPATRQRVCGILYCDGCVNSQLVHEGIAWHDSQACPSTTLTRAQESARKGRRGLWQNDRQPTPPWQWRTQRRASVASTVAPQPQGQEVADLSRFFEANTPPAAIEAASQTRPQNHPTRSPTEPRPAASGNYWLTDSSGIRHNSRCRYYQKSKGRPGNATEGRPCKRCGG